MSVLTSGFRLLTNKTLCPPEAVSPDRPSRLAAAAAAAMPPCPIPRDAKALGIPGTDRPKRNKIWITLNLLNFVSSFLNRSGKENIKPEKYDVCWFQGQLDIVHANVWSRNICVIINGIAGRKILCTDLPVGWQRLGGRHELHHMERQKLCLVQLE